MPKRIRNLTTSLPTSSANMQKVKSMLRVKKMIEFCLVNKLKITNTFFKHKPIHLTTWQSPAPYVNITDCKTNTPRRNPFRNQIDYILVRNNTNTKVFDSKATISTTTNSDHKPVIAKIMIKWKYQSKTKSSNKRFNIYYMKNQNIRNSYQNEIESYLIDNHDQPSNNQNSWNKITKMLKQAAENTIGYVNKSRKSINEDVKELSLLKGSIKIQIESCINEENGTFLKIYRNRILTEIHSIIKNEENEKIKQTTAELENMQNDSSKMHNAVKKIKHLRTPQKLLIKGLLLLLSIYLPLTKSFT